MADDHWIQLRRDPRTGIETVRAHFTGHAYDPHGHDELLIGITQQGVQRFRCQRALHTSTPGRAILIEPGAVHDGHAPDDAGFTYAMLYLPQDWTTRLLAQLGLFWPKIRASSRRSNRPSTPFTAVSRDWAATRPSTT